MPYIADFLLFMLFYSSLEARRGFIVPQKIEVFSIFLSTFFSFAS